MLHLRCLGRNSPGGHGFRLVAYEPLLAQKLGLLRLEFRLGERPGVLQRGQAGQLFDPIGGRHRWRRRRRRELPGLRLPVGPGLGPVCWPCGRLRLRQFQPPRSCELPSVRLVAFSACRLSSFECGLRLPAADRRVRVRSTREAYGRPPGEPHWPFVQPRRTASAQTSSQIKRAADEFGSSAAAAYSMSSGLMRPPTSASNEPNPASASSSSISKLTTEPSASLPMKIRSRTRIVSDSTSAINSGAISPVNLFPGKPTMMYSTGPMVM